MAVTLSAGKRTPNFLACSKRSDSGERCRVKKAMKSRGGLGREVRERCSLFHLFSSLAFIFSRSFLLRTAPHYLNAWNRLLIFSVICPLVVNGWETRNLRRDNRKSSSDSLSSSPKQHPVFLMVCTVKAYLCLWARLQRVNHANIRL